MEAALASGALRVVEPYPDCRVQPGVVDAALFFGHPGSGSDESGIVSVSFAGIRAPVFIDAFEGADHIDTGSGWHVDFFQLLPCHSLRRAAADERSSVECRTLSLTALSQSSLRHSRVTAASILEVFVRCSSSQLVPACAPLVFLRMRANSISSGS